MKDYFKYCNAFVILTREGVVLTSDDTRITPEEDRYLQNLNRRLSERKYKRGKGSMTLDIKALREQLNKTRRDIDRNVYLIKSAEAKMLRVDPGGGEFYDLIDTVENVKSDVVACPDCSENEILDKIQAEQLKTVIWTIVDDLPGIAPEVLRARFQEDLTLKETAARVGTTVEAVRQWQSKGLRELRKPSMSNELKPFIWDDYVYNQALRGNGAEHFNRTWTSSTERIALEEW